MGIFYSKQPKLKIPYCPSNDDEGIKFTEKTFEEKIISEYTGINILAVENLDLFEYCLYLRDGYIYKLNQTEKGREYLDKCYSIEQTAPDRNALRNKFGKG
jgi:hypothetical protein